MPLPPAKKHFGQHFLRDKTIAGRICDSLQLVGKDYDKLMEIGPGQGVLTKTLYPRYGRNLYLIEIDRDLIPFLKESYPLISDQIINKDFLELDFSELTDQQIGIIGNFPYNISSQILFRLVENKSQVPELVGMFQREVAQRVASGPGNKDYGLLSVWVQAFYRTEYLFTVQEGSFSPPPKVKSGVIRLTRKEDVHLPFEEKYLLQVIKQAFNQRRKTLRNALSLYKNRFGGVREGLLDKRAEQLGFEEFIYLTEVLLG